MPCIKPSARFQHQSAMATIAKELAKRQDPKQWHVTKARHETHGRRKRMDFSYGLFIGLTVGFAAAVVILELKRIW